MSSLRLRYDDVGRGFLYRPTLGDTRATPPQAAGARFTKRLTSRAARKIKGAALKADSLGLGLVTFMTFTCDLEARVRVDFGDITLGREMKRTLNAMQERFRRKQYGDFAYVWVAENPGEANPHVHLLTNHRVPRAEFREFAAWVESLWGHGFAKIQVIHKPESAARYILKAVGYALKGEGGHQGRVRGNRYGISRNITVKEVTYALYDREAAAHTLMALGRSLPDGSDVEQLAPGTYLTPHGLAFGAGTPLDEIDRVVDDLEQGAVPG